MSGAVNPHYMNMNSLRNESPDMAKRDPLIDYDLVPSGIPMPINALRAKAILSVKPLRNSPEFEYDYDIPKVPKMSEIKGQTKPKLYSNNQKRETNLETELQIFV